MKKQPLSRLFLLILSLAGCKNGTDMPDIAREALVTFEVKAPLGTEGKITKVEGYVTDKSMGTRLPLSFRDDNATLTLAQGSAYALMLTATFETREVSAGIEYTEEFVAEKKESYSKPCQLLFSVPKESFVISEIFFAGTRNERGEQYDEDKYLRITNNSPVTRFLDGLVLLRSLWISSEKKEQVKPDVSATHFVTDLVMQFPGNGHDYPVLPYETVTICHSAQNHAASNPNSLDLSGSDFEWMSDKGYTDSGTPDNPAVPNMSALFLSDPFGEGMMNWSMNTNGQNSYALADIRGLTAEQLVKDYAYSYTEVFSMEGMDPVALTGDPALMIPIDRIIDAVNLGMPNNYQWRPISGVLDSGYAFVADNFADDARYGKTVVRKPSKDGERRLMDSNNSLDDFESREIK